MSTPLQRHRGKRRLRMAAAHLLLCILVTPRVIAAAAAQPHNAHAVVFHNGIVNAVAALGGLVLIAGIVIAGDKQQGAPGNGHQKLQVGGFQVTAGDDEVNAVQPAGNIEVPQCRTFFIGDEQDFQLPSLLSVAESRLYRFPVPAPYCGTWAEAHQRKEWNRRHYQPANPCESVLRL